MGLPVISLSSSLVGRLRLHSSRLLETAIACSLLLTALGTAAECGDGSQPEPTVPPPITSIQEAELALAEHRNEDVEGWAAKFLEETEDRYGSDSVEAARAIDILLKARCARPQGCGDDGDLALASRALRTKEKGLGPDSLDLVPSLMTFSQVVTHRHDPDGSIRALIRALGIGEKQLGPDSQELIALLEALNSKYREYGPYEEATRISRRLLTISEAAFEPNDPRTISAVHEMARTAWRAGDIVTARSYSDREIAAYETALGTDNWRYAAVLNLRGCIEMDAGDYAAARRDLEAGLEARQRFHRPLNWLSEIGQSLNNLAALDQLMGDLEHAADRFRQTIHAWETDRGPRDADVALAELNLAMVLYDMGKLAEARGECEHALRIIRQAPSQPHPYLGPALSALGKTLTRLSDLPNARVSLEEALSHFLKRVGENHPDTADTLVELAAVAEAEGRLDEAAALLQRALRIKELIRGPQHPDVATTLVASARVTSKMGHTSEAFEVALRAARIHNDHLRLTARALPERQALKYAALSRSSLETLTTIAAGPPLAARLPEVWDATIRSRATILDELAARHRSLADAREPELSRLADNLEQARARLGALILQELNPERTVRYRELLAKALEERERAERSLAERSAAFRQAEESAHVGYAEVQQALSPGTGLVAFARFGGSISSYGAFVLAGPRDSPVFLNLGPSSRIDEVIHRWRNEGGRMPGALRSKAHVAERRYSDAAAELRRLVWDPLLPALGDARTVFVVPEGEINLLSFATLPTDDGRYLLEVGPTFHYLSTERDLVRTETGPAAPGALLAIGGPDFDGMQEKHIATTRSAAETFPGRDSARRSIDGSAYRGAVSTCSDFTTLRFESLPAAATEAREVASLWAAAKMPDGHDPAVRVLIGPDANERSFKKSTPQYRILHLATHGFFLDDRCETSPTAGGFEALGGPSDVPALATLRENPLLRSGLALSGANRRVSDVGGGQAEDGVLTADEIASLDLSGVGWVVLAACETGLGKIQNGEGVLGLRRAFAIAGARSVIMSLWRVSDDATRAWMRELYRGRRGGLSTADAVHRASLRVLQARRRARESTHPFYWGAFVAAGDWR